MLQGSELVQKYIGEGSRMVRELFVMAREHAPSIIFMDEVGQHAISHSCPSDFHSVPIGGFHRLFSD